jgi:2'-5' RNA ligase
VKSLFFVALVLPEELILRVQAVKQEFSDRFGTRHGLHTIPHITIIPPFPADEAGIAGLIPKLAEIALEQSPFEVMLDGFDRFGKDVLFVRVIPNPSLEKLFNAFQAANEREARKFHPHVTIAHRDVTAAMLAAAWGDFEKRPFKGAYTAASISLLKLEDGRWVVVREFPFGEISP